MVSLVELYCITRGVYYFISV